MGETRVDLLHLLEDLRDAYPCTTDETILTEIIANSLDSRATAVALTTDPVLAQLTIADDGEGMRRREFRRYHDIAASAKVRGERIGFAGVGAKIALLVSTEVLTETRTGKQQLATIWSLASRHRAPWRWIAPPGLLAGRGTAVRLSLTNPLSPLLDAGFIEECLRRHFQPLLDPACADILEAQYPRGMRFVVNEREVERRSWEAPRVAPISVRLARRRKPAAAGYMISDDVPLPEERRGMAVSTLGKVIKHGWDWLGLTPATAQQVGGLIEIPALAGCLTLNKGDFIRAGARGATYLAFRKAVQEAVAPQLAAWGDVHEADAGAHRRAARPAERDLETVLRELAEDFPLIASLVEARSGGQRRLAAGAVRESEVREANAAFVIEPDAAEAASAAGQEVLHGAAGGREELEHEPPRSSSASPVVAEATTSPPRAAARASRYGLNIQFEERPDDSEVARLVESTVWINAGHPAYRRAVASRSEGYHLALASALALAPLAVEPAKEHAFVTAFLTSWGRATEVRGRRRRGQEPPPRRRQRE